ncbi:hypothetical protein, partial [Roseibium sp. TrichSKD4]|uniref:hypothetical protein n=1 Tax=Roseibium sp. TrichSKD4 TaxID=744980 RepID=UPI00143CAD68
MPEYDQHFVELRYLSPQEWDIAATGFDDCIPEQLAAYNSGHWGNTELECVEIWQNERRIGGAIFLVRKLPSIGTGIAVTKWGPLWQPKDIQSSIPNYKSIVSALQKEFCQKRNLYLTLIPVAYPGFVNSYIETLEELDFTKGAQFASPERYIVNVSQTIEELKCSYGQKWRYNLNKSLYHDLDITFIDANMGLWS